MLDFYADNAIEYVCFNTEEQEGQSKSSDFVRLEADSSYRSFLETMVRLNLQRDHPILIREIENAVRAIHGRNRAVRNMQAEPLAIISVDCEANISTFSPELLGATHSNYGSFCFGNLRDDDLEEITARIMASQLYSDVAEGLNLCATSCSYFEVCGGGAPSNKIFENGSAASTETMHCRAHKRSIDVVLDLIERLPSPVVQ